MLFSVYLLRCRDGSYYAGHTDDMEQRLNQHASGHGCAWTRSRRPVELVWSEETGTRIEALEFERRIKGWTRAKKEALIAGDWTEIGRLARPPSERLEAPSVRPERSAAKSKGVHESALSRPSTSLRTNGDFSPGGRCAN